MLAAVLGIKRAACRRSFGMTMRNTHMILRALALQMIVCGEIRCARAKSKAVGNLPSTQRRTPPSMSKQNTPPKPKNRKNKKMPPGLSPKP
mmetsp:Transcript_57191/g.152345  ORF Transcript_57191/g.152345 Transcript_57191/m.152345 type:complete len:91 (-) Transcript_57191:892-1164(-)